MFTINNGINCTKGAILVSGLTAISFLPEHGEKIGSQGLHVATSVVGK